jgi:hypothetical protein
MFSTNQLSRSFIRSTRRFHQVVVADCKSSRPAQFAIFESQIVVATRRWGSAEGHRQIYRGVKVLNLGRGFEITGKVALDEIAASGQRPGMLDGFLPSHPELRSAPGGKGVLTHTSAQLRGER